MLRMAGRPNPWKIAFSDNALPILPFPSSNGWTDSKYKWAIAERTGACFISDWLRLNQFTNCFISPGTRTEGGASKCTLVLPYGFETTCMGSLWVLHLPSAIPCGPFNNFLCHENNMASVRGSFQVSRTANKSSATPSEARSRTRWSGSFRPSWFLIDDITSCRLRYSPSI